MSGGIVRHEPFGEVSSSYRREIYPILHIEMGKYKKLKFGGKLSEVGVLRQGSSWNTVLARVQAINIHHIRSKLRS